MMIVQINDAVLLIKMISKHGLVGVLVIVLFVLFVDPDRVLQFRSNIAKMFFYFTKKGAKTFIGSNMSLRLNKFFNKLNVSHMFGVDTLRFKIKWVTKYDDPIFTQNGTIILKLESEVDQTKNILKATQLTLPSVVCPSLRRTVEKKYQDAIDLTLLKKMSESLGPHAYPIFEKYFLSPSIEINIEIAELYSQLVSIDRYGIFTSIFLEELNILSSRLFAEGIVDDLNSELAVFIQYLIDIANRDIGDEIQLNCINKYFQIGTVLVAKTQRVLTEGFKPYIERIGKDFFIGCQRIYLIGFAINSSFFNNLHKILYHDNRFNVSKVEKIQSNGKVVNSSYIEIISVEKNNRDQSEEFISAINKRNYFSGKEIYCSATEVFPDLAIFDCNGIGGYLYKANASWSSLKDCTSVFTKHSSYTLDIIEIDQKTCRIFLTNRNEANNPTKINPFKIDQIINVCFNAVIANSKFVGLTNEGIEIIVPKSEMSWSSFFKNEDFINKTSDVIIYEIDQLNGIIYGSIKRNVSNPWTNILGVYPRDSIVNIRCLHIDSVGVYFLLPNGLTGFMSNEKVVSSPLNGNVKINSAYKAVIDKIMVEKHKIFLKNLNKI